MLIKPSKKTLKVQAVEREFLSNNWVTLVFILNFILLFLMKLSRPKRIAGYSVSFFTKGFFINRVSKKPSFLSFFYVLLFLFSTIVLSLFVFLQINYPGKNFSFFSIIFLGITAYFSFRFFVDFLIVQILGISKYTRYFTLTKSGYLYNLCLWLFPVLIFTVYTYNNPYISLVTFAVLVAIRFILILVNNKNLILSQLFYFILYLCALEIAPLLILYKLLTK